MHQIVQVAGALLILAAFVLAQFRVLDNRAYGYLWPNFVGSTVLTVDAWREEQWGFFILEFVWAVVSAWGIVGRVRGREPAAAH
jgi:hypothetical protein